jgi:hypothetical protein
MHYGRGLPPILRLGPFTLHPSRCMLPGRCTSLDLHSLAQRNLEGKTLQRLNNPNFLDSGVELVLCPKHDKSPLLTKNSRKS